jgi:predicted esterase
VACLLLGLQLVVAQGGVGVGQAAPGAARKLLQQDFWWQGLDGDSDAQVNAWWADLANRIMASSNLLDSRTLPQGEPLTAAPTAPLVPETLTPQVAEVKANSTIIVPPTRQCKPDGDGGTLCGIGVGYEGTGRTGVYYLPRTYTEGPLPVMILLHGSGVNGNWMLQSLPFKEFADKNQIIVVAPDSKFDMYWIIPETAEDPFTHDFFHIEASYQWFVQNNTQGALVDTTRVSIVGNSRAGYVAPPFCSRSAVVPCSAAVILHASALPQQMGTRVFPILWTAGERDELYGPNATNVNRAYFASKRPEYPIVYNVWESGHSLNKGQEIDYVCAWVANPSFRNTPAPPLGSYRRRLAASPAEQAAAVGAATAARQQLLRGTQDAAT